MEHPPRPPDSDPGGSPAQDATPVEAGLRLITERLGVPAVLLFAAGPSGDLRVVGVEGSWGGDALALCGLAESLDGGLGVLDVPAAIEGARFAAGARLGNDEGVLLVLAPDDRDPDAAWNEAFAGAAQLALGLVRSDGPDPDRSRLLYEVAVHPGTMDERLALALERVAQALGLDAAAFARTEGGEWTPQAVYDPSGALVPTRPVPLADTFCAFTARTDGPFVVEDAAAREPSADGPAVDGPAAYLGAPVFAGGRCVGTLSVVGRRPRTFAPEDRRLVESVARWLGTAVAGRDVARQLADREAALASFFDGAPMGMGVVRLVVRPDGAEDLELVAVNTPAAHHLGAPPEALVGQLASGVGVDDGVLDRWIQACRDAGPGGRTQFEFDLAGPDGPRTFTTTVSLIGVAAAEPPADARFTFVIEDVTGSRRSAESLREREAALEAVVQNAPVALFLTDGQGRVTMSRGQETTSRALGLDRAAGLPLADVLGGSPEAAGSVHDALAGAEATWTVEADGQWFECRVLPVRDDIGLVNGLIGVAIDVTDRERGARALARANRAVESVARARTAFLKHLNHEIRSPLTSILGYADILSEASPPDEVIQVRDVIVRSGHRLISALDDLLDVTLLDGTDVTITPTPTNLGELVEAVTEANRTAAEARRIALNVWCRLPDEPLLLDAALVERVVRHLVGGAVASATGSRVDVRLAARGAEWVELRVLGGSADDGALGIGPDLVFRLVEAMGGDVDEVAGEVEGTVVRFPRRPVPVVEFAPPVAEIHGDGAGEAATMAGPPGPG